VAAGWPLWQVTQAEYCWPAILRLSIAGLSIAGQQYFGLSIAGQQYSGPSIAGRQYSGPSIAGSSNTQLSIAGPSNTQPSIAEYGRVVPDSQIHRITYDFSGEGLKSSNFTYDYSREGCKSVKTILFLHWENQWCLICMFVPPT